MPIALVSSIFPEGHTVIDEMEDEDDSCVLKAKKKSGGKTRDKTLQRRGVILWNNHTKAPPAFGPKIEELQTHRTQSVVK